MKVRVRVNGVDRDSEIEPRLLLVHYLREVLGLTGTNVGCDTSQCGACTVHMSGGAVKACTVLAVQADGTTVTTIEGLRDTPEHDRIGAGVDLTTACDIRLAAADAVFSVRETRIAMVADVGTLQRLPFIIDPGKVAELVYTGRDWDAREALEIGFVSAVHEDAALVQKAALEMAGQIAANSPLAVQGSKAVLNASRKHKVQEDLDTVALWNAAFLYSDDLAEAIQAFVEKRPPDYQGR